MVFASLDARAALKKFLTNGKINYDNLFKNDWLNTSYTYITNHDLEFSSQMEKFVFWVNAYNILTLKSVQMELDNNPNWNGNTSILSKLRFFFFRKFQIGDKKLNLYNLENKILRKEFKEPRVHFVINCAANSCPFIPDRLISMDEIEEIMERYTLDFINQQGGVIVKNNILELSKIFKWYKKDFQNGIIPFIKKYWKGDPIPNNIKIRYQEYDWSLNRIKS